MVWNREKVAFLTDSMFRHQKIVIRDFSPGYRQFRNIPGISGNTIMGNDEIVLIIDAARIAAAA